MKSPAHDKIQTHDILTMTYKTLFYLWLLYSLEMLNLNLMFRLFIHGGRGGVTGLTRSTRLRVASECKLVPAVPEVPKRSPI